MKSNQKDIDIAYNKLSKWKRTSAQVLRGGISRVVVNARRHTKDGDFRREYISQFYGVETTEFGEHRPLYSLQYIFRNPGKVGGSIEVCFLPTLAEANAVADIFNELQEDWLWRNKSVINAKRRILGLPMLDD